MTLFPVSSGTVRDVRTAIVVLGNGGRRRGSPSITRACLELVREAERLAANQAVDVVVLTGGSRGGPSEAEQMRAAWQRPAVELVVEPTAWITAENAARTLPLLLERGIERAVVVCAPLHVTARGSSSRGCSNRTGSRPPSTSRPSSRALARSRGRSQLPRSAVGSFERHRRSSSSAGTHERHARLHPRVERGAEPARCSERSRARVPSADVLVVDDGSTDRTADVSREHGAEVLSLGRNRGLPVGIAAGYRWAFEHDYAYCGRVDADGQHPAVELSRLLELVRADHCDVAVGSRFVSGDGYAPYRYRPDRTRRFGTAVLRRAMALVLRRPFGDATSGLYAVNAKALPLLAEEFTTEAPEVEALIRIVDAGLAPRGGAGRHGGAREWRVEASRREGDQGRAHRRRDARHGEVDPGASAAVTGRFTTERGEHPRRLRTR